MRNVGDNVASRASSENRDQTGLVAVLLSTYNGEQYLQEQLDSLVDQSHKNFVVHVRDDGSTDGTVEIIEDYQTRFPDLFKAYIGDNLGSSASFYWLLEHVKADLYFFCDQDDVWFTDKIEQHLKYYGEKSIPEMVFSDLEILFGDIESGKKTLLGMQKMDPNYLIGAVTRMLCQNPVAGCAMSLNHAAKQKIFELGQIPEKVVHDHWFAVVTAMYGNVYYLPAPLIYYRLHAANQIGSQTFDLAYVAKKLVNLKATILYDLQLLRGLPFSKRPMLMSYVLVKVMANLRRIF